MLEYIVQRNGIYDEGRGPYGDWGGSETVAYLQLDAT